MTNLRWILLASGVAILLFLYLTGRPRNNARHAARSALDTDFDDFEDSFNDFADTMEQAPPKRRTTAAREAHPNAVAQQAPADYAVGHDPYGQYEAPSQGHGHAVDDLRRSHGGYEAAQQIHAAGHGGGAAVQQQNHPHPEPAPGPYHAPAQGYQQHPAYAAQSAQQPQDYYSERPPQSYDPLLHDPAMGAQMPATANAAPVAHGANHEPAPARESALGRTLGKLARFTSRREERKEPVAETANVAADQKTRLVILYVEATEGVIDGQKLLYMLEHRGFMFGSHNIFHFMQQGKVVMSIANMYEPGYFDAEDLTTFNTPGLSFFMQLPGPMPAIHAFDLLINEAREFARGLECHVLDENRCSLSHQTEQHLRDQIRNYMVSTRAPAMA